MTYPSQEYRQIYYEEFSEHLTQWNWTWFCTLTFPEGTSYWAARRQFNRWRLKIINREKLQLGAFLISSYKRGNLHFHVLLLGRNGNGKTLKECNITKWERAWRHHAKIKQVDSNEGVCIYVSEHFLGWKSDHFEYDFYGRNLLEREKNPHTNGDSSVDIL